jgi:hypothetical protein
MKNLYVRLLLPALGIGLVATFLLEWINSAVLNEVPHPGKWAEWGLFAALYMGGMMVASAIHGTEAYHAAGGHSVGAGFFKGVLLWLGVWLCFVVVCSGVSGYTLEVLVGLPLAEVRWLKSEGFLFGFVLGTLLCGGPALQARLVSEQASDQPDSAGD